MPDNTTLPRIAAYYVEPHGRKGVLRVYGPFPSALAAFRAAFFMHSREDLYAAETAAFANKVARDYTYHEPGELRYIFREDGWHEMGYTGAVLLSAEKVPTHASWKERRARELAESHVLNNARSAGIISRGEEERLSEEWRRKTLGARPRR